MTLFPKSVGKIWPNQANGQNAQMLEWEKEERKNEIEMETFRV